eukprot:scaffold12492_cov98-Isochrysis_galbana.AAC.4
MLGVGSRELASERLHLPGPRRVAARAVPACRTGRGLGPNVDEPVADEQRGRPLPSRRADLATRQEALALRRDHVTPLPHLCRASASIRVPAAGSPALFRGRRGGAAIGCRRARGPIGRCARAERRLPVRGQAPAGKQPVNHPGRIGVTGHHAAGERSEAGGGRLGTGGWRRRQLRQDQAGHDAQPAPAQLVDYAEPCRTVRHDQGAIHGAPQRSMHGPGIQLRRGEALAQEARAARDQTRVAQPHNRLHALIALAARHGALLLLLSAPHPLPHRLCRPRRRRLPIRPPAEVRVDLRLGSFFYGQISRGAFRLAPGRDFSFNCPSKSLPHSLLLLPTPLHRRRRRLRRLNLFKALVGASQLRFERKHPRVPRTEGSPALRGGGSRASHPEGGISDGPGPLPAGCASHLLLARGAAVTLDRQRFRRLPQRRRSLRRRELRRVLPRVELAQRLPQPSGRLAPAFSRPRVRLAFELAPRVLCLARRQLDSQSPQARLGFGRLRLHPRLLGSQLAFPRPCLLLRGARRFKLISRALHAGRSHGRHPRAIGELEAQVGELGALEPPAVLLHLLCCGQRARVTRLLAEGAAELGVQGQDGTTEPRSGHRLSLRLEPQVRGVRKVFEYV